MEFTCDRVELGCLEVGTKDIGGKRNFTKVAGVAVQWTVERGLAEAQGRRRENMSICSKGRESPTAPSEPLHPLDCRRRNWNFLSSLRLGEEI